MALSFVTTNEGKFREAQQVASEFGIELEHVPLPYLEIQSDKLEDIAKVGAQQAYAMLKRPCFVEDSGLFIEALKGFPGAFSSYVFKTIGNLGILKLMEGMENRRAEFKSTVGYCERETEVFIFTGVVKGRISTEIRGDKGFGYDPIFIPDGEERTFAELSTQEKNVLSHRGKALRSFLSWLVTRS
jgi:XTP/dITP diphosphohydrolase